VGGARVWQITSEARRGPLGGDRRVPERHLIGRVSFDAAFCKKPRRVFLIQESHEFCAVTESHEVVVQMRPNGISCPY